MTYSTLYYLNYSITSKNLESNKRDHLKNIAHVTTPHIVASNLSLKASSKVSSN